jgi:hypothetical protein
VAPPNPRHALYFHAATRIAGGFVASLTRPYDSYSISAPDPKNPAVWNFSPIEGQVTRIVYCVPDGHTVLELSRNYEHAVTDAGPADWFK